MVRAELRRVQQRPEEVLQRCRPLAGPHRAELLPPVAAIVLVLRPVLALLQRGFNQLALVPGLTALVRWQNYRYVLRQSLTFFQNDFAGRIAQKVMQTGPSLRETVGAIIDGVWTLLVYLAGTAYLFFSLDPWLFAPIVVWLGAYIFTIWRLVPSVRERSAAVSEANSGLSGRIVDSYTNIQSVKLFAHAEREDAFALRGFDIHINAFRNFARTMATMIVSLSSINRSIPNAGGYFAQDLKAAFSRAILRWWSCWFTTRATGAPWTWNKSRVPHRSRNDVV